VLFYCNLLVFCIGFCISVFSDGFSDSSDARCRFDLVLNKKFSFVFYIFNCITRLYLSQRKGSFCFCHGNGSCSCFLLVFVFFFLKKQNLMRTRGWLVEYLTSDKAAVSPTAQILEVGSFRARSFCFFLVFFFFFFFFFFF
jgi:hypothetical protein